MSLLDEDSEIIKRNNAQVSTKKSGRKAKKSGLNRFANSLNKYKHLSEQHKQKMKEEDPSEQNSESILFEAPPKEAPKKIIKDQPQAKPTVANLEKVIEIPVENRLEPINTESAPKQSAPLEANSASKNPEETFIPPNPFKSSESEELEYELDNTRSTQRATLEYETGNTKSTLEYDLDNHSSTTGVHKGLQIGVPSSSNFPLVRLLGGQKRQLLNLFFEDCKYQGSLTTGRLLNELLSGAMDVKPSTLKTLVYRLAKDGFIERLPGKRGRGGWIQVMLPKPIYDQLLTLNSLNTVELLSQNIEYKLSTERGTQRSTNSPSSSSKFLENKTTTTNELPKIWQIIQIPQNLKDIGISTAHITQIANDGFLSPDEVQDSLEAFSYDLGQGSVNAKFGPLRLLLGVLRKQKVPYISQSMIEQERRQLEEYIRKKEEAEAIKKQQAELGLMQKFEKWWDGLSREQRNQIAPPNNFYEEGSQMQRTVARGLYLENPTVFEES